jgi:hypothetical protein
MSTIRIKKKEKKWPQTRREDELLPARGKARNNLVKKKTNGCERRRNQSNRKKNMGGRRAGE